MKLKPTLLVLLLLLSAATLVLADAKQDAEDSLIRIFCDILFILTIIAPAIGVIILTLEGIRWAASADDPGARKKAKEGIIHVFVGLTIVVIAVPLVSIVIVGADRFSYCIDYYGDSSVTTNHVDIVDGVGGFITSIKLYKGWNLISTPIIPNENLSLTLNGIDYEIIYSWNSSSKIWRYYVPDSGGDIMDLQVDEGYLIHVNKNTTLTIRGSAPPQTRNVSLNNGWNLVGYSGYNTLPIDYLLEDVNYLYVYTWNNTQASHDLKGVGWSFKQNPDTRLFYTPPIPDLMRDSGFGGMSRIELMDQGMGYWIYVDTDTNWVYNSSYPI